MTEYIECRDCTSLDCKGCNLKNLETMLKIGKFDCLMNGNRCIVVGTEVAPVRHGQWIHTDYAIHWTAKDECSECAYHTCDRDDLSDYNYCPNCGAKMDMEE